MTSTENFVLGGKRRSAARIVALAIAFLSCTAAHSADFELRRVDTGTRYEIIMRGTIVPGDAKRLSKLITNNPAKFLATQTINVSSPGGDVKEAIELANLLEDSALEFSVPRGEVCASACFFLLVGAMDRLGVVGTVLIHRPYISPKGLDPSQSHAASTAQQASISEVRRFLERKSVPSALVDKMMMLPSTEAYEVNIVDRSEIGYMNSFLEELAIEQCELTNSGVAEDYRHGGSEKLDCVDNQILIRLRYEYLVRKIGSDGAGAALRQSIRLQKLGFPD